MTLTPATNASIAFVVIHFVFSLIAFPIYFLFLRESSIIKARSLALEFYMWLLMAIFQLRLFQIVYSLEYPGEIPCSVLIWSGWVTPVAMLSVTMKCLRLILIFAVTTNKLKHMNESEEPSNSIIQRILVPKSFSGKTMSYVFLSGVAFFGLFPLAITGYAQTHWGSMHEDVCHTIAFNISAIVSFAILLILIALCVYQLIKVHDAYYVKIELKALGYVCLCVGLPAYILTFVKSSPAAIWGWVLDQVAVFFLGVVSFGAVPLMAWRHELVHSDKSSSEMQSNEYSSRTARTTASEAESSSEYKHKHRRLERLVRDHHALPFLESYLIHYQEIMLSNYLLLWNTLKTLQNIQEPLILVSKTFMAYGKFLGPNAYIFVDNVTPETRDKLIGLVNKGMESETEIDPQIPTEIHREILEQLEEELEEKLFKPFIKTKFYQDYIKAGALNQQQDVLEAEDV